MMRAEWLAGDRLVLSLLAVTLLGLVYPPLVAPLLPVFLLLLLVGNARLRPVGEGGLDAAWGGVVAAYALFFALSAFWDGVSEDGERRFGTYVLLLLMALLYRAVALVGLSRAVYMGALAVYALALLGVLVLSLFSCGGLPDGFACRLGYGDSVGYYGYAVFLLSCYVLSLVLVDFSTPAQRWGFVLLSLVVALLMVLTGTRAVAWLFPMLVVSWVYVFSGRVNRRLFWLLLGVGALGVFLLMGQRFGHMVSDLQLLWAGDYDSSLGHRAAMYLVGWDIIRQHPLLGVGISHYLQVVGEAVMQSAGERGFSDNVVARIAGYTNLHNQWLTDYVMGGLVGFLLSLLMLLYPLVVFVRGVRAFAGLRQRFALAGLLFVLAVFLLGLQGSLWTSPYGGVVYVLTVSLLLIGMRQSGWKEALHAA